MRGWALGRVTARHGGEQPPEGGIDTVGGLRVAMQPCDHGLDAGAGEHRRPGQALQENKTERIDIRWRADVFALGLLRTQVLRRAHDRPASVNLAESVRRAIPKSDSLTRV
jgi:hypothetical protein